MKFLTSFYWQEQENETSLVLQQICVKKGRDSLLLACVCDSRDFSGQLVDLLHEEILSNYARRGSVDWGVFLTQLQEMEAKEEKTGADAGFSCAGMLCLGSEFLLFGRGRQRVYLFNKGFKKSRMKKLMGAGSDICKEEGRKRTGEKNTLEIHQGIMESGISILLATEPFYARLTEQMLLDCLGEDIRNEQQASLHLKELGEFSQGRGGQNLGAVLIHTQM